jgi:hypothetical protein
MSNTSFITASARRDLGGDAEDLFSHWRTRLRDLASLPPHAEELAGTRLLLLTAAGRAAATGDGREFRRALALMLQLERRLENCLPMNRIARIADDAPEEMP